MAELIKPIAGFTGEFRFLSNFWHAPVSLDGVIYPSVEHAYQAAKTLSHSARKPFLRCTPGEAKRYGRRVELRSDWDGRRLAIMQHLLRQKFAPPGRLAAQLDDTDERPLIETNTWGDTFYGVCRGAGENHLGRLLMTIRSENRAAGAF